jgi:hypothetical protein
LPSVRQLRAEFRLADVVIAGGKVDGDKADLQVSGQMTAPRLEPTGEIIEATHYPVKGTVSLVRYSSGSRPSDSELERTFE